MTSDKTYNVHTEVATVSMVGQTQTQYVLNSTAALQIFTFTDKIYEGLDMTGILTFDGPKAG